MRKIRIGVLAVALTALAVSPASAGLLGTYYNLDLSHPDMETAITGLQTGWVQSTLAGDAPSLTALGALNIHQFDWWDSKYMVGQRIDSDDDLRSNFANSWFPDIVNTGLPGDPQHFAVKWSGTFYVDADKSYTYTMGSDDDSWLFIDDDLVLDLGGIHAITYNSYTLNLTAGYHTIDIFFAERHVVQSGFQLNFFSDLEPTSPIPEPGTLALFGFGLAGGAAALRRRRSR